MLYDRRKYLNYFQSSKWKSIREQFQKNRTKLHLHHITYNRLYNELLEDLRLICESCHIEIHKLQHKQKLSIEIATEIIFNLHKSLNDSAIKLLKMKKSHKII